MVAPRDFTPYTLHPRQRVAPWASSARASNQDCAGVHVTLETVNTRSWPQLPGKSYLNVSGRSEDGGTEGGASPEDSRAGGQGGEVKA